MVGGPPCSAALTADLRPPTSDLRPPTSALRRLVCIETGQVSNIVLAFTAALVHCPKAASRGGC